MNETPHLGRVVEIGSGQALMQFLKHLEALDKNNHQQSIDVVAVAGPEDVDLVMENLFNPFYASKEGALGLGLAMTKEIIEDHDGKIKITSSENTGAAVEFRLPLDSQVSRL